VQDTRACFEILEGRESEVEEEEEKVTPSPELETTDEDLTRAIQASLQEEYVEHSTVEYLSDDDEALRQAIEASLQIQQQEPQQQPEGSHEEDSDGFEVISAQSDSEENAAQDEVKGDSESANDDWSVLDEDAQDEDTNTEWTLPEHGTFKHALLEQNNFGITSMPLLVVKVPAASSAYSSLASQFEEAKRLQNERMKENDDSVDFEGDQLLRKTELGKRFCTPNGRKRA